MSSSSLTDVRCTCLTILGCLSTERGDMFWRRRRPSCRRCSWVFLLSLPRNQSSFLLSFDRSVSFLSLPLYNCCSSSPRFSVVFLLTFPMHSSSSLSVLLFLFLFSFVRTLLFLLLDFQVLVCSPACLLLILVFVFASFNNLDLISWQTSLL